MIDSELKKAVKQAEQDILHTIWELETMYDIEPIQILQSMLIGHQTTNIKLIIKPKRSKNDN